MPPLDWPSDLPGPKQEDFNEDPGENKIISPVESGRRRKRKRFSTAVGTFSFSCVYTKAQLILFRNFYAQLNDGVDTFMFPHPLDGVIEVQFMESIPRWNHIKGKLWAATLTLERVP